MEELELMTAIIDSNPGINVEDAWKMYRELITRVHSLNSQLKVGEPGSLPEFSGEGQSPALEKPAKGSLTGGYTRRSLKVKPQDAITKDAITCCICGKIMSSINARHLASHNGLTKEGYLKLCGYPADQALMSLNHLSKMKSQVLKAQKAREKKQSEGEKAPAKVRKNK
jgi:predicted transcriptional regulator